MSGFTSIKDMFDGGGAGGSGSEYSLKSHDEYKKDYKEKQAVGCVLARTTLYVA